MLQNSTCTCCKCAARSELFIVAGCGLAVVLLYCPLAVAVCAAATADYILVVCCFLPGGKVPGWCLHFAASCFFVHCRNGKIISSTHAAAPSAAVALRSELACVGC
jgi:hypothetical protein